MIVWRKGTLSGGLLALTSAAALTPATALAQTAPADASQTGSRGGQVTEIVVTAHKQEESANKVSMTITAATGEALRERHIDSVNDLTRVVPGFTVQQGAFNSTSFTLRGVGFFNSDLGTPPAVTVYVDEAPLPYPAMTKLAAFDLERVEVLKGPQGTLFGQNATGGAVNYIAAKPTGTYQAGLDLSYGAYNRLQTGGFVSGPVTDTVQMRLALQWTQADPWQESVTRPGDKLGRVREFQGRATVQWSPNARFSSRLTFTGTHDGSDSVASQFIAAAAVIPALAAPGLLTFPVVTKPTAADWTPTRADTGAPFPYANNTNLFQVTWRNDYKLTDTTTLTSLTSYADFHEAYGQDTDGTPFHLNEVIDNGGYVGDFFQELRIAGKTDKLTWLAGANYTRDMVKDAQLNFFRDKDVCNVFIPLNPNAYCDEGLQKGHMKVQTYGVFGRVEYSLTDTVSVEAGGRYNMDRRTFDNCGIAVTTHHALFFDYFQASANGGAPIEPIELGHCWVLNPANNFRPVSDVHKDLDQDSFSWRVGVNWKPTSRLLVYANASKGFKAGTVPVVGAATTNQFAPVPQESVLAYEVGFKAALFDRHAQFNAAAFYYDYRDKQLRGSLLDPAFGPLEALVSIPKSHVEGAEAQLTLAPIAGLVIDSSVTYVHTRIDQFMGFDAFANFANQAGTPFPFSPEWQSVTNIDYTWPISDRLKAFVGGTITYNSKTYAGIGAIQELRIDPYTLVDLRAGVQTQDGRYRLWAWGENVTNEYYWNNVFAYGNSVSRYVGMPATWGVSLSYRFR